MAEVYRRGRVWWVRFRADGQHVRRSARTHKKSEAQAFLLRLMDEHAAGARDERPRHPYAEAVERFFAEASIKPRTKASYQSNDKACRPTLGSLRLADINRRALADHISARKQAGVTDATIRRDLAFLSSLFSMAIRWEWVDTNSVTAVSTRSLKESRPRTRFLTRTEFSALKRAAPDFLKPMLVLAVETGMRREELLSVTVRSIDLQRQEVHLDKTKTNAPRRVPLTDTAVVTVEGLLNAPNRPSSPYLFCKADGSRYVDPKKAFASALKCRGIKDFRWHDLRHTFASWWVQGGGDLYRLSRVLGHSTLQMSARYGHLRTDDLHDEMRTLAQKRSQERQTEASRLSPEQEPETISPPPKPLKRYGARRSSRMVVDGAPGTIRTSDPQIRRTMQWLFQGVSGSATRAVTRCFRCILEVRRCLSVSGSPPLLCPPCAPSRGRGTG